MNSNLILHGYWRSSAAYRGRIALNFKGMTYDQVSHDLLTGAQNAAGYRTIAPQGLVPALVDESKAFIQSTAILEWLEERRPQPALLPADIDARAIVRSMIAIVACDIGVDLSPYPALVAAGEAARALSAFIAAHPDLQPDADR